VVRFLIAMTCMLAFYAGYDSATVSSSEMSPSYIEIDPGTSSAAADPGRPDVEAPAPATFSRLDIYGNEVDAAVSDYRIDPHGDLYESHAPDTALLKLSSPSS
jgi:hypothetical protein